MTTWITTTDRAGRRAYCTPAGSIVSKDGCGRTPVTVLYPGHAWNATEADYGMTDTVAEAKAWAELDEAQHAAADARAQASLDERCAVCGEAVMDTERCPNFKTECTTCCPCEDH